MSSPMLLQSNLMVHVFRLRPHEDLKKGILDFASDKNISAGIVLTCVGSLEQFHVRYANQKSGTKAKGYYEIVSLTGTFSRTYGHFHISVSDEAGKTAGGHLLEDNLIYTTAEIAIGEIQGMEFERVTDEPYGYPELVVKSVGR